MAFRNKQVTHSQQTKIQKTRTKQTRRKKTRFITNQTNVAKVQSKERTYAPSVDGRTDESFYLDRTRPDFCEKLTNLYTPTPTITVKDFLTSQHFEMIIRSIFYLYVHQETMLVFPRCFMRARLRDSLLSAKIKSVD